MKVNIFALAFFISALISCSGNPEQRKTDIKAQQYKIAGSRLYQQHCSTCHQPGGEGLARLYPPLNKSDFMDKNLDRVACIIKYGQQGPLVVNGITFTQPMPGFSTLTNLEIAEIMTFIYNSWEHERGLIDVKAVDKMMQECDVQ